MQFKKYWRVFWFCRQVAIMKMMTYRGDFLFWAFVSTLWTGFSLLFYTLIVRVNQQIAGWTMSEMYLLLGVFTMLDAVIWSFLYGNMRLYTTEVFSGEITFSLVKPIDPQFYLMTRYNSFSNIFRLLIGLGVTLWAIWVNQVPLEPLRLGLFILTIFFGLLLFYAVWFMASTLSFWVEKLDNINDAFASIRNIFQVPHQIYTGLASTVLTVLLPLALISSVPSEVLLGRANPWLIVNLIIASFVILAISRWFFFFSIKRYSGVGS